MISVGSSASGSESSELEDISSCCRRAAYGSTSGLAGTMVATGRSTLSLPRVELSPSTTGSLTDVELADFGGAPRAADGGSLRAVFFPAADDRGCWCRFVARRGAGGGGSAGVTILCGGSSCSSCISADGTSSTNGVRRGGVASHPAWSSRALFLRLGTSILDGTVGGGRSGGAGIVRLELCSGRWEERSGSAGGRSRSGSAGVFRLDPDSERWVERSGRADVVRRESCPDVVAGGGRRVDVDRRSSSESSVDTNSRLRT